MRSTGIIRRIDDLGRVVIPKEIRREMRIREGDALEIFTSEDGGITFKKYSYLKGLADIAKQLCIATSESTGTKMVVSDRDHVIATCRGYEMLMDMNLETDVVNVINSRRAYVAGPNEVMKAVKGHDVKVSAVFPVCGDGEMIGSVILVSPDGAEPDDKQCQAAMLAMTFLKNQYSDY